MKEAMITAIKIKPIYQAEKEKIKKSITKKNETVKLLDQIKISGENCLANVTRVCSFPSTILD